MAAKTTAATTNHPFLDPMTLALSSHSMLGCPEFERRKRSAVWRSTRVTRGELSWSVVRR